MRCDLLIIGAGPAGSSAAKAASEKSLDVVVVEKRRSIGEPIECAEFVPKLLKNEINFSKNCIVQEIDTIKLFTKEGLFNEFSSPGYMLNRSYFDKELALEASKNGAKILINSRCFKKEEESVFIQQGGNILEIEPTIIIGADGPRSLVGGWIQRKNTEFVMGMQYELPLLTPLTSLEIHFWKSFFGGYGWLFPKGLIANVGIGIKYGTLQAQSERKILNEFCCYLEQTGKIKNVLLSFTAGLIPCSGLPCEIVNKNILLVGDAAGQTHPITGGGIPQAVICGKIAGQEAAKAIKNGNPNSLKAYEVMVRKIYGNEQKRAVVKRKIMEENWEDLDQRIKTFWPSFREYYD